MDWLKGVVVLFLKKEGVVQSFRISHYSASPEKIITGCWRDDTANCKADSIL